MSGRQAESFCSKEGRKQRQGLASRWQVAQFGASALAARRVEGWSVKGQLDSTARKFAEGAAMTNSGAVTDRGPAAKPLATAAASSAEPPKPPETDRGGRPSATGRPGEKKKKKKEEVVVEEKVDPFANAPLMIAMVNLGAKVAVEMNSASVGTKVVSAAR